MALQKSMLELRNRILTTSQQNQRRSVISFARPHDLVYAHFYPHSARNTRQT